MRICTPDKVSRRRRDTCGSGSCHPEPSASRGLQDRMKVEEVCQCMVPDWITAQSPPKAEALLRSSSRCEAGHDGMGGRGNQTLTKDKFC